MTLPANLTRLVYRLRVRNSDDTADLLVATSLPEGWHPSDQRPGAHPYIERVPECDGTSVDPITGQVATGKSRVRVIDAPVGGTPPALAAESFEYGTDEALRAAYTVVNRTPPGHPDWSPYILLTSQAPGTTGFYALRFNNYELTDAYVSIPFTGLDPAKTYAVRWVHVLDGLFGGPSQNFVLVKGRKAGAPIAVRRDAPAGNILVPWHREQVVVQPDADGLIVFEINAVNGGGTFNRWHFLDAIEVAEYTDPPGLIVTRNHAGADLREQYLSRQAYLEQARLDDCLFDPDGVVGPPGRWYFPDEIPADLGEGPDPDAVTVLQVGAVTRLQLATPTVWDFTLGDAARDRRKVTVFERLAPAVLNTPYPGPGTPTCVIGGPALGAWPSTAKPLVGLKQSWRMQVIAPAAGDNPTRLRCKVVTAVLPPEVKEAKGITKASDEQREARLLAYHLMQPFGSPTIPAGALPGIGLVEAGADGSLPFPVWFPRLRAQLHAVGTNAAGAAPTGALLATTVPLNLPNMVDAGAGTTGIDVLVDEMTFYWPRPVDDPGGTTRMPATRPAVGTLLDVVVYAITPTPATPLHLVGHVTTLLEAGWSNIGEPFDSDAGDALRALRPGLGAALRLTEPPTLTTWESDIIGGPFNVGTRRDRQGRKQPFYTRTRPVAPAGTITTAHLRSADPPVFTQDEGNAVSGVTYEFEHYRLWTGQDGERAADGLVAAKIPYKGIPPEDGPLAALPGLEREQRYTVPGFPIDPSQANATVNAQKFANAQALPILERRGRGAVQIELDVLPTADYGIGDEVVIEVKHFPGVEAAGAESGTAVGQRGAPTAAQVLRRTVVPEGFSLLCEVVGTASAADTTAPAPIEAETIADPVLVLDANDLAPTTVLTVRVGNIGQLAAFGLGVRIEFTVGGAATPNLAGVRALTEPLTSFADTADLPAVPPGSKVWVRGTAVDARNRIVAADDGTPTAQSAWQAYVLGTVTDGTGDNGSTIPMPTVVPYMGGDPGAPTLQLEVKHPQATAFRTAVSTVGPVSAAAVRAAPQVPFIAGSAVYGTGLTLGVGQRAWFGIYAYDQAGNESQIAAGEYMRRALPGPGSVFSIEPDPSDPETLIGRVSAPAGNLLVGTGAGTDMTALAPTAGKILKADGTTWYAGTLDTADIPALPASKIASGAFDVARLPTVAGVAGSYTNANVTIDGYGRITAAANGTGGGSGGGTSSGFNPNGITGTPSALDDDWSSGTIDAKWTLLNWPPDALSVNSRKPGYLWVKRAARASSHLLATLAQALPAGDFTVSLPITHSGVPNSISLSALIFMSGGTTAAAHWLVGIGTEPDWYRFFIQSGGNLSSITTNVVTPMPRGGNPQWIVTVRRAGTTYTAEFSTDGRSVHEVAFTPPLAPTYVGITSSPYNGGFQASYGAFRYSSSPTALFGTYS